MRLALVGRKKSAKMSARIKFSYKSDKKTVPYSCNTTILLRREFGTPTY